jgi:hypothetical protein
MELSCLEVIEYLRPVLANDLAELGTRVEKTFLHEKHQRHEKGHEPG